MKKSFQKMSSPKKSSSVKNRKPYILAQPIRFSGNTSDKVKLAFIGTEPRIEIEVKYALSSNDSTLTYDAAKNLGLLTKNQKIKAIKMFFPSTSRNRPPMTIRFRLVEPVDGVDCSLGLAVFVELADPFAVSWEIFSKLPQESADRLKERAWDENEDWIKKQLEEHDAMWILVCARKVIKLSDTLRDYPNNEELQNTAREYDRFPFVFTQSLLIEESGWSVIKKQYSTDFYPTLEINICGQLSLIADFDTGNPNTLIDIEQLLKHNCIFIDKTDLTHKSEHLGKEYKFFIKEIQIEITDDNGKKTKKPIKCCCVIDWSKSPFLKTDPNREALAGRDMLLEFPLEVSLHGGNKETYVFIV